jgi:hypothetical protein
VANADGRQFNLMISHDGRSVVTINEDKTTDDDVHKLRSAMVGLAHAINSAAEQATGKGNLTSLEIDTNNSDTVVWQIEFGGDYGTTVQVDATSGEVLDTTLTTTDRPPLSPSASIAAQQALAREQISTLYELNDRALWQNLQQCRK